MKCKPVKDFENEYVISADGDLFRRLKDGFKQISVSENDESGYKTAVLYKNGEPKFKYIHALVAEVWGDGNVKDVVNHKDGDKSNDSADNLEDANFSQNTQHAYKHGLAKGPKGEVNGRHKLTKKQVQKIRSSDKPGYKLAQLYGVTPAAISLIKSKKRW